ncbi:hypothetical protein Btru_049103 [Bulinus truncatus]|nr:hypothetical protein Btru_049103 [Bulinus truncatus]
MAWSMLGMSYDLKNKRQQGDYCFKHSIKAGGKHSQFVKEWHFIGPFGIGKIEFDGDPLEAYGGIRNTSKFRFLKHPLAKHYSELVPGGEVSWVNLKQNEADEMVHVRPKIDWNDLVSSLGSLGITEWQGWAVGEIFINEDNTLLNYRCLGVSRCCVDKYLIVGDLYHRNQFWFPITLSRGVYSVFIPLRSKVNAGFQFSVIKMTSFKVLKPPFLPDIQKSYLQFNTLIPVPISNLMTKKWLKIVSVKIEKQTKGAALVTSLAHAFNTIAPGQTNVVAVSLQLKDKSEGPQLTASCSDIGLEVKIKTSEGADNLPLVLRCRNKGSSFIFTFKDHDGSVQHAAAVEPIGICSDKACPVFLTLHGTTVPPQNQADSYKKMVRGDYEFGVSKMWLLAPTRHGAHNWEGPGAMTAMTALQALRDLTQNSSWFEMSSDPSKVLFAGHSMGGHGAWHLATHFPDMAVGLISLAGWIKKEEYGDSNLLFRHDISTSHIDPAVKAIMEACIAENDADRFVANLKVRMTELFTPTTRSAHVKIAEGFNEIYVTYAELPNLEHWWWDTKETNDGGCVNDADVRKFISEISESLATKDFCSKKENLSCSSMQEEHKYQLYKLVTVNPSFGDGVKGISVLQQVIPFRTSVIEMNVTSESLTLTTQNVQCLQINGNVPNRGLDLNGFRNIVIDGQTIDFINQDSPQIYCLSSVDNSWVKGQDWNFELQSGLIRGPSNFGPARRIAERQFLIIVGTQASGETSDLLLRLGVYIANQFFLTSDTAVTILEDRNVDETELDDYNIIILGTPVENLLTEKYLNFLKDVQYVPGSESSRPSLHLGRRCQYSDSDVGLMTLAPHGHGLAMLLMGLSDVGLENVASLATPTIPPMARSPFSNLLPDFVVTGPDVKLKGPGGFLCTGFWDNYWQLSASSASCTC